MTNLANYRFIDPRTLAAISDLPLLARAVVDGFMYGAHPSRMPGAGLEFSQYRSYQAGDDLRRVDWKLYGRSDRYFVRESEIETSLTLRIVVDATGSMAHTDTISKFDYARFIAASLALLAHRQGDAIGLYAPNAGELRALRPGRGQPHLHRFMRELEVLSPTGTWPAWGRIEGALAAGGNRGVTVVLSDLHERGDEIRQAVSKLVAMRHEVIVMHLATRAELDLSYAGPVALEEIETGRVVEIEPAEEREAYIAAVEREQRALRDEFGQRRVDYIRLVIDEPLDVALRTFLSARRRASGAA